MSLTSIQLCTIDPVDRAAGHFVVTAYSDDGKQMAIFDCSSEHDALRLRTAIREHADQLRRVADYRERKAEATLAAAAPELLKELRLLNLDENGEQRRNTPAARAIALATGSAA